MNSQQVVFHIPLDIKRGIDSGRLIRRGGIVRDQTGQIVKHLEEAEATIRDSLINIVQRAVCATENHKCAVFVGVGVAVLGTIAAAAVCRSRKNKRNKEREIAEEELHKSLTEYFKAMSSERLTDEVVDRALVAIGAYKKTCSKRSAEIDQGLAESLAQAIEVYTRKLCRTSGSNFKMKVPIVRDKNDPVRVIQSCFQAQKQIMKSAA